VRVKYLCNRWIDLSGIPKDYESLLDLVISEQLLQSVTKDLAVFLKESSLKTSDQITKHADYYRNAHPKKDLARKEHSTIFSASVGQSVHTGFKASRPRRHRYTSMYARGERPRVQTATNRNSACVSTGTHAHTQSLRDRQIWGCQYPVPHTSVPNTRILNKPGSTTPVPHTPTPIPSSENSEVCSNSPQKFNGYGHLAEISIFPDDTGSDIVDVSDVTHSPLEPKRDSNARLSQVHADSVTARAQSKQNPVPPKQLSFPELGVSHDELSRLQKQDDTLTPLFDLAVIGEKVKVGKAVYFYNIRDGVLYRCFVKNAKTPLTEQIVLPSKLRQSVLMKARDDLVSGHVAYRKTIARLRSQCYWPRMTVDVRTCVRSGDMCRKNRFPSRPPESKP